MKDNFVDILVVDDHELWRRFLSSMLQKQPGMRIIGEASDGSEGAQKAQKLRPDLVVLDISLPKLNGIEAARRIRITSPHSRILFVTENRSLDIAEEALSTGGRRLSSEVGRSKGAAARN